MTFLRVLLAAMLGTGIPVGALFFFHRLQERRKANDLNFERSEIERAERIVRQIGLVPLEIIKLIGAAAAGLPLLLVIVWVVVGNRLPTPLAVVQIVGTMLAGFLLAGWSMRVQGAVKEEY